MRSSVADGAPRFPDGKANAYYAKDSQWEAVFDPARPATFRYQYAALHAIGCCNLNSHRVLPTYVENMWMRSADGRTLVAALHGASEVTATVAGCRVRVVARTDYPFGHRVEYKVTPERAAEFSLLVRAPAWSRQTRVNVPGACVEPGPGWIRVSKTWLPGDVVALEFDDAVQVKRFRNNELFVRKGALIYALGFAAEKIPTREFAPGAFADYSLNLVHAEDRERFFGYRMPARADLPHRNNPARLVYRPLASGDPRFPFEHPPGRIEGSFLFQHEAVSVELQPMGSLLLRKVLFKQDKVKEASIPHSCFAGGVRGCQTPGGSSPGRYRWCFETRAAGNVRREH